ncbi:hypothetical protein [Ferruginibacter albus]|uniref:hypothetical protein n=1 Tax=Ferruginibacter albus TaxID=2875540 RepID=UPI001CC6AA11|nr:hypothetical protein [Ferruginibacter albus]UAY53141.1 hypothetical protein K9M53_05560 [Ferruginibacter albus]
MTRLVLLIFIASIFSCNNSTNLKTSTDPIASRDTFPAKELLIDKGDDEGWGADIRLSITEVSKTDSSISYFANSLYETKNLGFKITVPTASPNNEKELAQVLTIQSSGNISDNLVQTLSKLYKQKADTSLHFVPSKKITFIDLNEFRKQLGAEPSNKDSTKEMKVFFETKNPDDAAELYININEAEHWIEIKEKDDSYRELVIKGLTTK